MLEKLPYVVKAMTLDDIDQVIEIEKTAFSAPWSARAYRYEITQNDHSTILVVRQARISTSLLAQLRSWLKLSRPAPLLGYAGLWLLVDEVHICTIAVHPLWRGQGLGELLLASLLVQGKLLGACKATLEVRVSNNAALELYLKYGFQIVSRRKRYYTNNNEDAYIMTTPPFETAEFQANLESRIQQLHARLGAGVASASPQSRVPGPARDNQAAQARGQQAS